MRNVVPHLSSGYLWANIPIPKHMGRGSTLGMYAIQFEILDNSNLVNIF